MTMVRAVSMDDRGRFLLEYVYLLLRERIDEAPGFRHTAASPDAVHEGAAARGRERWVINKIRALCSWYSKGLDGGSALRVRVNSAENLVQLRAIVGEFFLSSSTGSVTPDEILSSVR